MTEYLEMIGYLVILAIVLVAWLFSARYILYIHDEEES